MKKYNLNVVVSPDRCDINDFVQIVDKINKKANDINVVLSKLYPADEEVQEEDSIEHNDPNLPSLTVCLIDLPGFNPNGKLIMSKTISKIKQFKIFKQNNINTPLTAIYDRNMDFSIFNKYVILKPLFPSLQSVKENIFVLPIEKVANEKILYDTPYIIQQFVDSGEYPSIYRAVVFLGEVLYKYKMSGTVKKMGNNIPIDFNNKNVSPEVDTRVWDHNQQVYDFAKEIANAFPDIPLLGVDIIEEANSNRLHAIEVNAGGNVWHFATHSRSIKLHPHLAEKRLNQYGAFNVAADALIKRTRKLIV